MRIVFRNPDNSVGIISPVSSVVEEYGLTALAEKDVPAGFPFWIVEDSQIPLDRTFRDAWEVPQQWGDPFGFGSNSDEFMEKVDVEDKQ